MKWVIAALCLFFLAAAPAQANCTTPCTKSQITTDINTNWPDNTSQQITPAVLRSTVLDLVNSYVDINGASSLICPTHQFLTAIATLSSMTCAQPNFTDLAGSIAGGQVPNGLITSTMLAAGVARTPFVADTTLFVRTVEQVVTITNASPAVVTLTGHGFAALQQGVFSSAGGSLPTGISAGQQYCVLAAGLSTNTFEIGTVVAGVCNNTPVNTSSAGAGTFTFQTGNDGGTGLTQTPTDAFLTIQGAVNKMAQTYDLGNHKVKLQLGCAGATGVAAFYGEAVIIGAGFVGGTMAQVTPQVVLSGDTTTPNNCVLSPLSLPANAGIIAVEQTGSNLGIEGVAFCANLSGEEAVLADTNGVVWFTNKVNFTCGNAGNGIGMLEARTGGKIITGGVALGISAGMTGTKSAFAFSRQNGYFEIVNSTVTLTGTPAFTLFAYADQSSTQHWGGTTFSGSATGQRHLAQNLSGLDTGGVGAAFFPGNSAGVPSAASTIATSGAGVGGIIY